MLREEFERESKERQRLIEALEGTRLQLIEELDHLEQERRRLKQEQERMKEKLEPQAEQPEISRSWWRKPF